MSNSKVIILVVVGSILLAVANVSLWATRDLFDPARFGEHVAEGLQTDAASAALAAPIVDRVLANHPALPSLVRVPAEEVVTWLLQRPAFATVFKDAAKVANVVMTTSVEDVVSIDISGAVSHVVGVVSAIDPALGDSVKSAAPSAEEIKPLAIYEKGAFPKLRQISNVAPWLWPLTALGAIALFAGAYWGAEKRRGALTIIGAGVTITALLELLFIPALHTSVVNHITAPHLREVVGQVLTVMTRGLAVQSVLLIVSGIVVIVAGRLLIKEEESMQASPVAVSAVGQTAQAD